MAPLGLNLMSHRGRQRWRRRGWLAAQMAASALAGGVGLWLLDWGFEGGGQPPMRQQQRDALAQVRRELALQQSRNTPLLQRWELLQGWRQQRSQLPLLLRSVPPDAGVRVESISQHGVALRLQAVASQAASAHALLRSLRADQAWRQVEWLGWSSDASGTQHFTLCLSPLAQPPCDDAAPEPS